MGVFMVERVRRVLLHPSLAVKACSFGSHSTSLYHIYLSTSTSHNNGPRQQAETAIEAVPIRHHRPWACNGCWSKFAVNPGSGGSRGTNNCGRRRTWPRG